MGVPADVSFTLLGDAGVVARTRLARALHANLNASPLPGVTESVPAQNSLTVLYDALAVTPSEVEAGLRDRLARLEDEPMPAGRLIELPMVYDGPDLPEVARAAGVSEDEVIALHAGTVFEVAFLGFLPGFAYLEGLPEKLRLPRRSVPRERVEVGSVAIGGPWAGVYPLTSPGGWHVLGHTDVKLFDASAPQPALLRPGDLVRFVPA